MLAPVGTDSKTRVSAWEYDAKGMLAGERIQPEGAVTEGLITAYQRDGFGNILRTTQCDNSLGSISACRNLALANIAASPLNNQEIRRTTRQVFDSQGRYANDTYSLFSVGTAAESRDSRVLSRDIYGNPTLVADLLGVQARAAYDNFGRKYFDSVQTGGAATTTYAWCAGVNAGNVACPVGARFRVETSPKGAAKSWTYHDVLGRATLVLSETLADGKFIATRTFPDSLGRNRRATEPYFATGPSVAPPGNPASVSVFDTVTDYDILDRPVAIKHPTGLSTNISYEGLTTTTLNPAGQLKTEQKNPLGEIIRSTDHDNHSTCYLHDAHGNLNLVGRSASGICAWPFAETLTNMVYDALGRKTAMVDADMGSWQYQYNAAGELTKQIGSRGQCTVNNYDLRGRLFRRQDYSNATCTTLEQQAVFVFDSVKLGRLGSESVPGYSRSFSYDGFGRPSVTTTTIDSSNYSEQTTYDHLGRVFQQFDASGQGVLTEYSNRGFVKRLRDARPGRQDWVNHNPNGQITFAGSWGEIYYEVRTMDAREQVTLDWRGVVSDDLSDDSLSGLAVTRTYRGDTGWLTGILAGDSIGQTSLNPTLQNLSFSHDTVGNVVSRHDAQQGLHESFGYDDLNRLRSVTRQTGATPIASESYGYDAWGNLLLKPGLSGIGYGVREGQCSTAADPGPHALSRATIAGSAKQYCYDAAGNQTATWAGTFKEREILYSAADQVKEIRSWVVVANHNTRFYYGPSRSRYKRQDTDSATGTGTITTTHYVGTVEIILKPNNTWEKKRYIGGVLVMTLRSDGEGSKEYLFTDHLGSTDRIAHRFGNTIQRMSFDAFGARRNPTATNAPTPWGTFSIVQQLNFDTSHTTHGFTGHEGADKVGLIHMNG